MISERTNATRPQPVEGGLTLSIGKYWDKIGLAAVLLLAAILKSIDGSIR